MAKSGDGDDELSGTDSSRSGAEEGAAVSVQLSEKLDPDLLRGVSLHKALSGFGKHWATPDSGMFNVDPNNYELSQAVDHLDSFLSHDWASSRLLKFLSLLIVFNSRAAFLLALAVSLMVGLLRGFGVLPDEMWTVGLVHVTYFTVFVFWQRLRSYAFPPATVFLDKLCIAQHNEELKQKGILGLAAFLLQSKTLVVLWTPRYFSRLWCTFEIATFLRTAESQNRIQIMPLKSSVLLLSGALAWHLLCIGHAIFALDNEVHQETSSATLLVAGLMVGFASCILPIVFYVGLGLMADLKQLPDQLGNFRVQDAQCFCCTNDHCHPHTGEQLPCDRRLVFKSLRNWYGRRGDGGGRGEAALERFNGLVREVLAPQVMAGMGGSILPLSYTVYMVGSCQLPFLSHYIAAWILQLQDGPSGYALFVMSLRHFMNWGLVAVISIFAVRVSLPLYKMGLFLQRYKLCKSRGVVVTLLVPLSLLLVSAMWMSYAVCLVVTSHTESLLPVLPFLLILATTLYLFTPPRSAAPRSGAAKSDASKLTQKRGHALRPLSMAPSTAPSTADTVLSI